MNNDDSCRKIRISNCSSFNRHPNNLSYCYIFQGQRGQYACNHIMVSEKKNERGHFSFHGPTYIIGLFHCKIYFDIFRLILLCIVFRNGFVRRIVHQKQGSTTTPRALFTEMMTFRPLRQQSRKAMQTQKRPTVYSAYLASGHSASMGEIPSQVYSPSFGRFQNGYSVFLRRDIHFFIPHR